MTRTVNQTEIIPSCKLLEHNSLCPVFQNFQIRFEFTRRKATVVISEKF